VQVAVNVSSRQFSGGALLDDLDAALRASGL
jgi:EAL domain-containing protein (putative c-di-GMP-specific phosphodiesterase class I)